MADYSSSTPLQSPIPDNAGALDAAQGPEEVKTARQINRLLGIAKRGRKRVDKDWPRYYDKGLRTKHWQTTRPGHRASPVTNYIFADIQTKVPLLTDGRPAPGVSPQHPSDVPFADHLRTLLLWWLNDTEFYREVVTATIDAMVYGTGIFRVGFDPEKRGGLGDAVCEAVDPFYVYPDPDARSFDDAKYVLYVVPTTVEDAKRRFAKKAKDIGGDSDGLIGRDPNDVRRSTSEVIFVSPAGKRGPYSDNDPGYLGGEQQKVDWIEAWIGPEMCEELEQFEEKDGQGNVTAQGTRKKYPKGKLVTLIGSRVMQVEHNPFDDGMIPFASFVDYILPRELHGQGEVEQLESRQDWLNKLDGIMLEQAALMSNAIWLYKAGSIQRPERLNSAQGLQVEFTGDYEPKRVQGVEINQSLPVIRDQCVRDMKEIHGAGDASQGIRPEGIEAAAAIRELKESEQTRIRAVARNQEAALKRVGKLLVSRFMQFYTEPRLVQIAGTEVGQGPQFFYFSFGQEQDANGQPTGNKVGTVQQVSPPAGPGQPVTEGAPEQHVMKGWFDISFDASSSLPFARAKTVANMERFMDRLLAVAANPALAKAMSTSLIKYGSTLEIPDAERVVGDFLAALQPPDQGPAAEPPKMSLALKQEMTTEEALHVLFQMAGVQVQGPISLPPPPVPVAAGPIKPPAPTNGGAVHGLR